MSKKEARDSTPTVFVVDDDPAARQALTWLLESAGRRAEAFVSGEAFLQAYTPERRGCLILDMRMPGMTGLALQEELLRRGIDLPVIVLTGYGEVAIAVEALQRGAIDFIEKPVDDARLLRGIDTAVALDAERRGRECLRRGCASRLARLSQREREVNEHVGISQKTVESHRARVMTKLEVQPLADLVRLDWVAEHDDPRPGPDQAGA